MSERINVLFPVETIVRELDFRLVLASLYARRRHRIFIGGAFSLFRLTRQLGGGLFVGKDLLFPTSKNPTAYHEARRNGFRLVFLGEEGAVFPTDARSVEFALLFQLDPRQLAPDDYICTWGDFQRDWYVANAGAPNPGNVRTTGHPRFDLYRGRYRALWADEARAIREKYGDFVLINSNFSSGNNPEGLENTFSPICGYQVADEAKRLSFIHSWRRVAQTLPAYVELVHKLAVARRDVNFVLRPHPSDEISYFRTVFRGVPNIHVVRERTVTPWLMACRAMIHDGCTTGIEGHMVGCPVVNFCPVPDPEHEAYIANVVGTRCTTDQEAIEAVLGFLDADGAREPRTTKELPQLAHTLFDNFAHDSFPKFLEVLDEAEQGLSQSNKSVSERRVRVDEAVAQAIDRAKNVARPLSRRRYLSARAMRVKFPGFDQETVRRRFELIERISGNKLDIRFHGDRLIEVESSRR